MGVNKYVLDAENSSDHEINVRKIDNSAVLQKQRERLQVGGSEMFGNYKGNCIGNEGGVGLRGARLG